MVPVFRFFDFLPFSPIAALFIKPVGLTSTKDCLACARLVIHNLLTHTGFL